MRQMWSERAAALEVAAGQDGTVGEAMDTVSASGATMVSRKMLGSASGPDGLRIGEPMDGWRHPRRRSLARRPRSTDESTSAACVCGPDHPTRDEGLDADAFLGTTMT